MKQHAILFACPRVQMVNQLQRLGLPQTSSLEQKRLALDLAGLVIAWEKRRRSASGSAKPAVRCRSRITN